MAVKQPLVEAVLDYARQQVYPLHTPGHKGGRGMAEPLRSALGQPALAMDVSLMSELDDIHAPQGAIDAAQDAAAALYGSDACFFAVNGTTGAIHAMLMAALQPGETVLIPRNAHSSVYGGLVLSGAEPVYVMPEYLEEFSVYGQVTPAQVEAAFVEHPELRAVLLTSPNYYGMAADVARVARIAHEHGALLLVDEAHGPHLGFSKLLPPSALQCGADLVAQSTHKLAGALTQCSLLHARGERLDLTHVAAVMSLLTTTSPNYLLLCSLDAARAQLQEHGTVMASQAVMAADTLRQTLRHFDGLLLLGRGIIGRAGVVALDETKVLLNVREWPFTGMEVADALRQAGVAVELADAENVLFLVTYADYGPHWKAVLASVRQVLEALERLAPERRQQLQATPQASADAGDPAAAGGHASAASDLTVAIAGGIAAVANADAARMPEPVRVQSLQAVFHGKHCTVPAAQAIGRVSAESIACYPPGVPVIVPGEVFTPEVLAYLARQQALGVAVHAADSSLQTLRVVTEDG